MKKRVAILMAIIMGISPIVSVNATSRFTWDEETLRGKPEWVQQYPNGLVNFATVGYISEEDAEPYEVAVIRQGGTEGEATVTFKAVGITAEYGKDYVLLDAYGNELIMDDYIPPLIDTLLPTTTPQALTLEGIEDVYKVLEESYVATTSPAIGIKPPVEELPEINITKPQELEKLEGTTGSLNLKQVKKGLYGVNGIDFNDLPMDMIEDQQVDEIVRASMPGVTGTLTFQPGERIKYFTVKILEDNISEDEELFALILQQPTNGAELGTINSINVYIQDNEPKTYSSISLAKDSYSIEQGASYVELMIQRKEATHLFASVQVGTGAITAKPGQDYECMLEEVLFYPGETEKIIRIPIYTNAYQDPMQFGIKLSNPSNATLGQNKHTLITLHGDNQKPIHTEKQVGQSMESVFELDLPTIETPGEVMIPLLGIVHPKIDFRGLDFEQTTDEDGNTTLTAGYPIAALMDEDSGNGETTSEKLETLVDRINQVKASATQTPKNADVEITVTDAMKLNKDTIKPVVGVSMILGQFEDENGMSALSLRQMNVFVGVNGQKAFNFHTITPIGIPVRMGVGMEAKIMLMGVMTPVDGVENLALNHVSTDNTVWQAEIPMMIDLNLSAGTSWSNLLGTSVWGIGQIDSLWVPWENGQGTLTLTAGVEIFILTFKKEWALAEGQFDLFDTMYGRTGNMKSFEELQETIYLDELELMSRDYLDNQSAFCTSEDMMSFATAGEQKTTVLISNSYPIPQVQYTSIGNGKYLMAFLVDDAGRPTEDAGALAYSIYDEGSERWTYPIIIQDDQTLDSSPTLSDLGDKILIAWTSVNRPIGELMTTTSTALDVLSATDMYCQLFDKATASIEGPVFTITEEYGLDLSKELYTQDAMPAAARSKDGDIILFYTKTDYSYGANDGTIVDEVSELNEAYRSITYRLYDPETKTWREDYFPHEDIYAQPVTEGLTWGDVLKGQRLVDTTIPDEDRIPGCGPKITAMQAVTVDEMSQSTGYYLPDDEQFGDKAVLVYCVDLDGSLYTTNDQEIYIQIYYFSTHKMSHPVRLTNNTVADHTPQISYHEGESYLFWNQAGRIIYYDLQSLTSEGLEKINSPSGDYMYTVKEGYQAPYQAIDDKHQAIGNDFKVVAGEDDHLYVIWTEHTGPAIDFFGVALDTTNQAGESKNYGWSKPTRLTYFGDYTREGVEVINEMFGVVVGEDGQMHIAYYQKEYDRANYTPSQGNVLPDIISTRLAVTTLSQESSLKVEATFKEEYLREGEAQTVHVTISNTGLWKATTKGNEPAVQATAWIETDTIMKPVGTYTLDELEASEIREWTFDYTLDEGMLEQNPKLLIDYREAGFMPQQVRYTIPYEAKVKVNSISTVSPEANRIQGTAYVENIGNKPMRSGTFVIKVVDEKWNLYDTSLIEIDLGEMAVGEVQEVTFEVEVMDEWLTSYNTLNTKVYVLADGQQNPFPDTVRAKQMQHFEMPVTNIFTTLDEESVVTLTIGKVKELAPVIYPHEASDTNRVTVVSDDLSILGIQGYTLIPIKVGTTTVRVKAVPDGFEKVYQVTIQDPPKPPTPDSDKDKESSGGGKPQDLDDNTLEEALKEAFKAYFEESIGDVEIPLTIPVTHWAYGVILRAMANGVLDTETTVKIDHPISRGELAKLYGRMFKLEREEDIEVSYGDVNKEEEYAVYLDQLKELGILVGTGKDTFSPEAFATREQVVVSIVRLYEKLTGTSIVLTEEDLTPFKDDDISPWAKGAIAKAAKVGIAYGVGGDYFEPKQKTSYAHVLAFVERLALLVNAYE